MIRQKSFEEGQASVSTETLADNKKLRDEVTSLKEVVQDLTDKLKHYEYFEEGLVGVLEPYLVKLFKQATDLGAAQATKEKAAGRQGEVPSEITVSIEQPVMNVKEPQRSLDLEASTPLGRLAICYTEGLLPSERG